MLSDEDLDQLDALLLSLPDENSMLLSEFDGFCAGIIVCPEMIMPGEWLPCVWGNNTEQLEAIEDLQALTDLIMQHYNDIAQSMTPPRVEYGPLFGEDTRTGEILWESWCSGFERAMRLRPNSWQNIVESGNEDAAYSVNMLLALYNIAEGKSDLPKSSVKRLTDEAPDLIPNLVLNLNAWTKSGATSDRFLSWAAANQPSAPFQGTKVGKGISRLPPENDAIMRFANCQLG